MNRKKSLEDWQRVLNKRETVRAEPSGLTGDLKAMFKSVDWTRPVSGVLDSLSLTLLQMITLEAGVELNYADSLHIIHEKLSRKLEMGQKDAAADEEVIYIVSIAERTLFDRLTPEHLAQLGNALGIPVVFEHVCTPPSAILLSDLIFSDYFQPRLDAADFAAVERSLNKIRNASVLIIDDAMEMFYPPEQVYGALSHNMERDPRTDLISVRWQSYSQMHDRLPTTVVRGGDLGLESSTSGIAALSDYLNVPIFRIANFKGFAPFTDSWDLRCLRGHNRAFDPDTFVQDFFSWLEKVPNLSPRRVKGKNRLNLSDAIHYCSHAIKQAPLDKLLQHFNRFCLAGSTASVPYIRRRLSELNKPLIYSSSYAPEMLNAVRESIECILICGAMGDFEIDLPAVALQHVGLSWRTKNLEQFGEIFSGFNTHGTFEDIPASGNDWFHLGDLTWGRNREEWVHVRTAAARGDPA